MNKTYLQTERPAWREDGFMFRAKFLPESGGRKEGQAKFSGNIFALLMLIHMQKLNWDLGPLGFGITKCRLFILTCSCTRSDSLSMTEQAY